MNDKRPFTDYINSLFIMYFKLLRRNFLYGIIKYWYVIE